MTWHGPSGHRYAAGSVLRRVLNVTTIVSDQPPGAEKEIEDVIPGMDFLLVKIHDRTSEEVILRQLRGSANPDLTPPGLEDSHRGYGTPHAQAVNLLTSPKANTKWERSGIQMW